MYLVLRVGHMLDPARVDRITARSIRRGVRPQTTIISNYVFWAKPHSAILKRAIDLAIVRFFTPPWHFIFAFDLSPQKRIEDVSENEYYEDEGFMHL